MRSLALVQKHWSIVNRVVLSIEAASQRDSWSGNVDCPKACFERRLSDLPVGAGVTEAAKAAAGTRSLVVTFALHTASKLTWLVLGGDPAARSHRVKPLVKTDLSVMGVEPMTFSI